MTNSDFLNLNATKELLLFDIYDVDEFVLREIEKIKRNGYLKIWNVSKAKRVSFEMYQVDENKFQEDEISDEEYLYQKEVGNSRCFTKLNYEDFEQNFPLDELDEWYGDEWLYDFHYNNAFFQSALKWIDRTEGDASKKLRIRELINLLKRSRLALDNIKYGWNINIPLNKIQEKVILIFKRFDDVMLEGISGHYINIFPELFDLKESDKEVLVKQNIINSLINPSKKEHFYSYEEKLVILNFLSEDRNQWLKESADLVRFYNYCEEKEMINRAYFKKSTGMKLLRQLYNFFEGESIDSPRSKRLAQNKGNFGQFNFLDII